MCIIMSSIFEIIIKSLMIKNYIIYHIFKRFKDIIRFIGRKKNGKRPAHKNRT